MKKFHKLLMTSAIIVSIFVWNIHSTPVAAKPNYLGRWYNVGLSNEYISKYRVFQKDGQVHDYQKLKTGLIGSSYKWDYQVLDGTSLSDLRLYIKT
jgi:hypothetical protein